MTQLNLFSSDLQVLVLNNTRTDDNWVNATKWCEHFGKEWYEFSRAKETKAFLEILKEKPEFGNGYNTVSKKRNGKRWETWVHPLVAIKLAEWLSPEFDLYVKETFKRFLDNDPELITEMIGRTKDKKALKKIKASVKAQEKYLDSYHQLHDTIKPHGGVSATHITVNTHNTQAINLTPTGDRSHWSTEQKVAMNFLQLLQTKGLDQDNVNGHGEIVQNHR